MKVVLLNGSPAHSSHTAALLRHLAGLFGAKGCDSEVVDLLEIGLPVNNPVYHADASKSDNKTVRDFVLQIKAADVIVLGTPLYHGSFSGLIKTALDNLDDDAFYGKKILVVSNSSGLRNSQQAAQQLVIVGRTMGGEVYDRLIGTGKTDYEFRDGDYVLTSQEIIDRCEAIVNELT